MAYERRRAPRVEILERLSGHALEGGAGEVTVLEMSLGGMAVETAREMSVGSRRDFQLTLGDGARVSLVGRVRHCRQADGPDDPARFVSGIEFIDEEPSDANLPVSDLMKRVT